MVYLENSIGKFVVISIVVEAIFLTSVSHSQGIIAEPNTITFNNFNQQYTIKISNNGIPIKKADIKGWSFIADNHVYNHMVSVIYQDGGILVKPAELEAGTYDLIINTTYGKVSISVSAPLDQLFGSIEDIARMKGKTVEEVKREIGLYTPSPRCDISIILSPQYYEGQTIELKIDGNLDHFYIWKVNNKIILQGIGETKFEYTFPEPGDYTIEVIEKEGEAIVGSANAKTKVVMYEPIKVNAKMNQPITLKGVPNYTNYKWLVDGVEQNNNSEIAIFKFNAERDFRVECIATNPKDGKPESFVRTIYIVSLSKK